MRAATLVVVCVAALALPGSEATLALAALKLLKYAGLAKLKGLSGGRLSDGGLSGGGLLGGGLSGGLRGPDYYYYDQQYGSPIYKGGTPAFYIVPASHFDDYRYRGRRDSESVRGSVGGRRTGVVVASEEEFFGMLSRLDENQCVLRLVCEVARTPTHTLTQDERAIMAIFSTNSPQPVTADGSRGARTVYDSAYRFGKTSGNPRQTCPRVYGKCPSSPQQLVAALSFWEETQLAQTQYVG